MGDYYHGGADASGGGSGSGGGQSLGGGPLGGASTPEEIRRRRLATLERISATNTSSAPPTIPRKLPVDASTINGGTSSSVGPHRPSLSRSSNITSHSLPYRGSPARGVRYAQDGIADDEDAELQAALAASLNEAIAATEAGSQSGNYNTDTTMDMSTTDMDEADSELQAALSLSLQRDDDDNGEDRTKVGEDQDDAAEASSVAAQQHDASSTATTAATASTSSHNSTSSHRLIPSPGIRSRNNVDTSILSPAVAESYVTSFNCNVLDFHAVMWDSGITTENDKLRWLSQGINFRDYDPEGRLRGQHGEQDSVLGAVIANHGPWGLTQLHGGPCGVLAAVQAELLRLILFGRRDPLDYPVLLTNLQARARPDLSEELMLRSLAMSIALIVARAAMVPPAFDEDGNGGNGSSSSNNETSSDQSSSDVNVKLVLPIHPHELSWDDFEPWNNNGGGGTDYANQSVSSTLRVYTVRTPNTEDSAPKRQKVNASQQQQSSLEERIVRLAHSVTQFLLEAPKGCEAPLQAFRRPGGVVLLVMSLAFSRGPQLVQSEMDDPTAKLTSQFGHCGQELINLLLTGQAVSNVFDNTLRPSGELVCRGIQSRPAVGYLTQLESMRYLEVGGYYKTPKFPIWVVGSTSHFTVMFGDAACLQESQSDILLERCRRAFKGIDGGEENGFIPTQALGRFLKSLDLDIPDHGVQTLAATIEVHGANIILWDDLWKHTSRLLTGASLESVLQSTDTNESKGDGPPPLLLTQFGEPDELLDKKPGAALAPEGPGLDLDNIMETDEEMAKRLAADLSSVGGQSAAMNPSSVAAAASPMELEQPPLTDEELARKLQEEWNAEYTSSAGGGGNNSVTAVRGSPTPSTWSNLADDMNISAPLPTDPCSFNTNTTVNSAGSSSTTTGIMTTTTTTTTATAASTISNLSSSSANAATSTSHSANPNEGGNGCSDAGADPKFGSADKMAYEKYDRTFQLYHYNGLRGGSFKPFRVTRLSPEEAVGASISLMGNPSSSSAHHDGDLEDVIRTKWPSCMINWLGGPPPSID